MIVLVPLKLLVLVLSYQQTYITQTTSIVGQVRSDNRLCDVRIGPLWTLSDEAANRIIIHRNTVGKYFIRYIIYECLIYRLFKNVRLGAGLLSENNHKHFSAHILVICDEVIEFNQVACIFKAVIPL